MYLNLIFSILKLNFPSGITVTPSGHDDPVLSELFAESARVWYRMLATGTCAGWLSLIAMLLLCRRFATIPYSRAVGELPRKRSGLRETTGCC